MVFDAEKALQSINSSTKGLLCSNEGKIITGYLKDGAMGSSGGGWFRKLSVVCLHNNAIVARCILVTMLHCGTPEPRLIAIYIVSSVGTSLVLIGIQKKTGINTHAKKQTL